MHHGRPNTFRRSTDQPRGEFRYHRQTDDVSDTSQVNDSTSHRLVEPLPGVPITPDEAQSPQLCVGAHRAGPCDGQNVPRARFQAGRASQPPYILLAGEAPAWSLWLDDSLRCNFRRGHCTDLMRLIGRPLNPRYSVLFFNM